GGLVPFLQTQRSASSATLRFDHPCRCRQKYRQPHQVTVLAYHSRFYETTPLHLAVSLATVSALAVRGNLKVESCRTAFRAKRCTDRACNRTHLASSNAQPTTRALALVRAFGKPPNENKNRSLRSRTTT